MGVGRFSRDELRIVVFELQISRVKMKKKKTKRTGVGGADEIGVIKEDLPMEVPFKRNSED